MISTRPFRQAAFSVAAMVVVMAACDGGATETPVAQPSAHATAPNADDGCPMLDVDAEGPPDGYRHVGNSLEADLRGDGSATRSVILGDQERPPRCRYFLAVEDPEGAGPYAPIEAASSMPHDIPSLLMAVEIDGETGLEVVVDFGGPMHPHRTGQIFTFEGDSLVPVRTERPRFEGGSPILFPLHDEFAGSVDCAGEPGALVVTAGGLARGGTDDSQFEITRTFYRAQDGLFFEIRQEMHTVEVGTERERWPELADDPFRSCPAA